MDKINRIDFITKTSLAVTGLTSTPAKIALAWLPAQKPFIVPIPGTTNPEHLKENIDAVHTVLSDSGLEYIKNAFAKITVLGDRMSKSLKQFSDVNN